MYRYAQPSLFSQCQPPRIIVQQGPTGPTGATGPAGGPQGPPGPSGSNNLRHIVSATREPFGTPTSPATTITSIAPPVPYPFEIADPENLWNGSRYTVPENGLYSVTFTLSVNNPTDVDALSFFRIVVVKIGSLPDQPNSLCEFGYNAAAQRVLIEAGDTESVTITVIVPLEVGDGVFLQPDIPFPLVALEGTVSIYQVSNIVLPFPQFFQLFANCSVGPIG